MTFNRSTALAAVPPGAARHFAETAEKLLGAAQIILPHLETSRAVDAKALRSAMETAFGGSDAEGLWDWKSAYDACEAAQILLLRKYANTLFRKYANPQARLVLIEKIAGLMPTHTRRSETSQALQQFSTPAGLAYVAGVAAALQSGERVLEPSAGTGLLAIQGEIAGSRLMLNELAETRAALLALLFPGSRVTAYDAAYIHDYLDPAIVPDVVVMNPPFSAVTHVDGRMKDAALRHIGSALARLRPGGRLVVITGASCAPDNSAFTDAFVALQERGRVLFSAAIDGRVYRRHGTTIDTRLTVIDRTPANDPRCFPEFPGVAPDTATLLGWVLSQVPPRTPAPDAPPPSAPLAVQAMAARPVRRAGDARPVAPTPMTEGVELAYAACAEAVPGWGKLTDAIYEPYALQSIRIPRAKPHPTPLVQSVSMASVPPPVPSYRPTLPAYLVDDGVLSDAQLESIILAGEAHGEHLAGAWAVDKNWDVVTAAPDDAEGAVLFRRGWMLGDGTGAGKGRQVAGIILDNWLKGRRRAVWVSRSETLHQDAMRDWEALGQERLLVTPLSRFRQGKPITLDEGILFATYATLRSQDRGEKATGGLEPRLGDHHLRTLTVSGFPTITFPGLLDELNRLAFEYRWSTRAIMLDKTDATKLLTRIRRQWFAKRKSVAAILKEVMTNEASVLLDSDASNKANDADMALQELGADMIGQAYVTATVTVWDTDPAIAAEKLRLVEKVIQGRDFTVIAESMNAIEAWLGSLPGHVYANVRQPPISTLNLAHLIPLSAVWAGPERDEHFGSPPLLYGKTEGSTPFRFSLHVGSDVGHTLIVGPTGAGKSVLLALMAMQFRRYDRAQIFAFDFGGSIRAAAIACGGDWQDLGGSLHDGALGGVSLQPLGAIHGAAERSWAAEWLAAILAGEGVVIDPQAKEHLWSALVSLASAPPPERTLTGLAVLLQSQALKQALAPYCVGGAFGALLDAEAERLGSASFQAFETEGLADSGAAPAVLSYLFHRIEGRLDGSPTLIIIDEGWLVLDSPAFAQQLKEWLKTLRKKNASVIFATQSLADIETSAIAPAIIESCPTRIFLPNDRAVEPQISAIYQRFGLNDRQIEILSRAAPRRDYYCQSRKGNRLFELGLGEVALAFTAASAKSDQLRIAELVEAHGAAGFAAAWLRTRGLGWAAELLPDIAADSDPKPPVETMP